MNRERLSSRLRFYFIICWMCDWIRKYLAFSVYGWKIRWRAFVLVYLFFLIILGLPIIVMEYSVGRASQKSIAKSFHVLEKKGQNGTYFRMSQWWEIIC